MHVVYLQDHDGHKKDKDYIVEPTLGRRLCNNGVTIPYVTHVENLKAEKEERAKSEAKAEAEKEAKRKAAEKAKIEKLLKKKEKPKREKAISAKTTKREKSIF